MKARLIGLAALAVVIAGLAGCSGSASTDGTALVTETRRAVWESPFATGQVVSTSHYNIYSTATPSTDRLLPAFLEAAYKNYINLTGLPDRPPQPGQAPLTVYMLGTRREWAALTGKVTGPLAEKFLGIEAGGYCFQGVCVFWDLGPMASLAVASHEGLHQFFFHRLKHRLPAWLEEGLCATAEGYEIAAQSVRFTPQQNTMRFSNLRDALVAGRWIPLGQLLAMDAGDIATRPTEEAVGYYGQLWALVQFIRSREPYRLGLQRLLADAEAGRLDAAMGLTPDAFSALLAKGRLYNQAVGEKLFRHYICDDLTGFEQAFRPYAARLAKLR